MAVFQFLSVGGMLCGDDFLSLRFLLALLVEALLELTLDLGLTLSLFSGLLCVGFLDQLRQLVLGAENRATFRGLANELRWLNLVGLSLCFFNSPVEIFDRK